MEACIEKNYLLFLSQFSFCKAHSTQHAILEIVYTIQTNMGKRLFSSSCGIFIDLKTAFDTVDHKIILDKLYHYGFCGIINKWLLSYLKGRTQTTQIVSFIPRGKKNIKRLSLFVFHKGLSWVHCFFLPKITISKNVAKSFSTDTNILYEDNNLKSLEDIPNLELRKSCDWLMAKKLTLNINKANFVIFCLTQRKLTFQPNITIFHNEKNKSVPLERKEFVKYLGNVLDQNLTWKHHIDHEAFKISRYVGLLSKLRQHVPTNTLITIYRSLISHI